MAYKTCMRLDSKALFIKDTKTYWTKNTSTADLAFKIFKVKNNDFKFKI